MTSKETAALDKKIEALGYKISKAKERYDGLIEQMSELVAKRYPERQEEAVKARLFEAYKKSGKTVEFVIDFIENAPDEDGYWN